MPRYTSVAWWCGSCGTKNSPAIRVCGKCSTNRVERCAQVRESERAVIYVNPLTGERQTPPRADTPMPEHLAQRGFVRQEIMNMTSFERETGIVHEATNFNPGNEPCPERPEERPKAPPELINALIEDMRAANASGPWTGFDKIKDSVSV